MFLRVVRATVGKGVKRDYVRVVEAYRDDAGKTQHRTVINLGRRDVLAAHLDFDKLRRLLHGDAIGDAVGVKREDVDALGAWDWGPMLAARTLWRELGLDSTLDQLARRDRRDVVRLSDRALVLVANRLTAPGSEHALAQSAIGSAGASSPAGATTPSAMPAGRRGCAFKRGNCSNGIARSTNCTPARTRPSTRCFSRCVTCSRCASTWCSTI